ncbi:MAG: type II secretion system major pseudopilin GspG [Gammaproteobacteria bacterium]|nr:type II secretion system major pseudopilin GspG [Gammaproteobacteria bacterium]
MNNFKRTKIHRMQGFTLIEIIVVVVIIGLLAAVIAPNIFGQVEEARIKKSLSDLRALESALNLYRLDNFNYPSTDQGIQALVTKPSGSPEPKNWRKGGYIPRMPLDPWGSEYQYAYPGASGSEFDLFTFGADGKLGGEENNKDLSTADLR